MCSAIFWLMCFREDKKSSDTTTSTSGPALVLPSKATPVLHVPDLNLFLEEQMKEFAERRAEFETNFPDDGKLITHHEAVLVSASKNSMDISQHFYDAIGHVEEMLRTQLTTAIGKELTAEHFNEYMTYHNKKIFSDEFRPRPFAYSVRQPDCAPEGIISLERKAGDGSISEPINTFVKEKVDTKIPMEFSISASSRVQRKFLFLHLKLFRLPFMEIATYTLIWTTNSHLHGSMMRRTTPRKKNPTKQMRIFILWHVRANLVPFCCYLEG